MERFNDLVRLGVTLLLLFLFVLPLPVYAAASDTVTVNATPGYVSITNAPNTWDMNGITGSGAVAVNTRYYANPNGDLVAPNNPVVNGDCRFTITNASTVATNMTVTCSDFGGGMTMTNSNTGGNGATAYGAYCWNSGDAYPANQTVVMSVGSSYMHSNLAATTNLLWGMDITTRTNAWTNSTLMQATATLTATQAY